MMRNALTVALAAGVCLLDIGAALAAPPAAAPAGTAGLSNNYMFGWDVVSGTYRALAVDQYGEIYCNNCSGGGGGGGNAAASLTGTTVPTSADYLGFSVAGSLVGVSAANPLPISGTLTTSPTGTQAVSGTLAVSSLAGTSAVTVSNSPTVSLAPSSTVTLAAGASTIGTVALSSNTVTLAAGASAIGTVALGTGTSNIGTIAGSSANLATYLQAVSSGGFNGAYATNAATSSISGTAKASAGLLYSLTLSNGSTQTACARIFASASVTVGSGTPLLKICAGTLTTVTWNSDVGMLVGSGITYDATAASVDTDTSTFTAAGVVAVNLGYK